MTDPLYCKYGSFFLFFTSTIVFILKPSSHHLPRLALLFAGGVILVYLMNEIKMLLFVVVVLSFGTFLFVRCGQSCKPARGSPVSLQLLSRSSRKCFSSVFACGWDRYQVSVCGRCPFAEVLLCSRIYLFFYVILC